MAALLLALALAGAAALLVPGVRWRAEVIGLKARGALPDVPWAHLATMLVPGSPVYLRPLADAGNPYAVIRNPRVAPADVAAGGAIFRARCASCHGGSAEGGTAPALVGRKLRVGESDWALFRAIEAGIPGTAMPAWDLPADDTWRIVSHLRSLDLGGANLGAGADAPPAPRPVTRERLAAALGADPAAWLSYGGDYRGQRFSPLAQVTRATVGGLALRWVLPTPAAATLEVTPLVNDGTMYVTVAPGGVLAVDAGTGHVAWRALWEPARDARICCNSVNRGVALLGGRLFVGTLDAHLLAYDAASGELAWSARLADNADGYGVTSAPLAVEDMVVVGVSGSTLGIRGFIDAYDAATGRRRWRFDTVPGPGAAGHDSWAGASWRTGGAAPWTTGTYDPRLGLVYWGTGNPAPVHNGDLRRGDNLYSDSVVALEAATCRLRWHFQFTPHDVHDMDSTQVPVLADAPFAGRARPLMLVANRNGFYYVLDRGSGEFLLGRPYSRQTWAEGLDARGRPLPRADAEPTAKGVLVWPNAGGATNWWPPAFDPVAGLVFVPEVEFPSLYFKGGPGSDPPGLHLGGSSATVPGMKRLTSVTAIRYDTGAVAWRRRLGARVRNGTVSGLLATAAGLVFAGDDDVLYALDSATGAILWSVRLGAHIKAPPVTYEVDGRQQLTVAAGTSLFTFALPDPPAGPAQTR